MRLVFHLEFIGVMQCKNHLKYTSNIIIWSAYITHILQKVSLALLSVHSYKTAVLKAAKTWLYAFQPIYWNHLCLTHPLSSLFHLNELKNIRWISIPWSSKGKLATSLVHLLYESKSACLQLNNNFICVFCIIVVDLSLSLMFSHTLFL